MPLDLKPEQTDSPQTGVQPVARGRHFNDPPKNSLVLCRGNV